MALHGSDEEKFQQLTSKTHKEQVIWFLNAVWHNHGERDAETLWNYKHKCDELDLQNGSSGNSLDELNAHRFLESFNEPMTVKDLRDRLRETGAIDRVKVVPITHFLLFKYNVNWRNLVNASQGDNQAEVDKAQVLLNESKAACELAIEQEKIAQQRKKEAIQAQQELEAALAELKAQEDAFNSKKAELERKSEEGGVVSKNKAKAELAQLLSEDPLPLRRAKITTEAAVKKAERTRVAAEEAAEQASNSRVAAEARVEEAEAYLNEIKARAGSAQGAIWWMERELHEQRKYLPSSKGGIAKK